MHQKKGCVIPIQTQLAAVGVEGHIGKAGYYFMPDFEVIRPMLAVRWYLIPFGSFEYSSCLVENLIQLQGP